MPARAPAGRPVLHRRRRRGGRLGRLLHLRRLPFPEPIRPPIEAAFNGVPIVAFINEVFGTELGMSFVISPGLQEKTDLVTLRLTSPVPPRQFLNTARQVMQEYGAAIRERDGVPAFLAV